ncbi:MAG: phosphatidate cytidylyltransferase [Bacteroidetes bacterium]|nr:phosphatidate cytidylyltransferase [Bacteroidota bacterium]
MAKSLGLQVEEIMYGFATDFFVKTIIVSFAAGALLIFLILKKRPELKRELWTKYMVYLLVVLLSAAAILTNFELWWLGLICGTGFYEIIRISHNPVTKQNLPQVLLLYLVICGGAFYLTFYVGHYLFWLYALIVLFDGFSQLAGLLFGRHKLAPQISPAKTWEGLAGGFTAILLTLLILPGNLKPEMILSAALLSLLIASGAVAGDLLASKWKRLAGVKDYGSWIPAHGGILDRFDGFIGAAGVLGGVYAILRPFLD